MEKIREKGSLHLIWDSRKDQGGSCRRLRRADGLFPDDVLHSLYIVSDSHCAVYATDLPGGAAGDHRDRPGKSSGICAEYCGRGFFQEYRRAACIRHHGALVIRKRNAGADQRAEYHLSCRETRNWLVNRIYSMLYMFLFVIALIVSLLLLVMGNRIHEVAMEYVPFLGRVIGRILAQRRSLFCDAVSCFSGTVPVSSKQKGNTEKSGAGSFSHGSSLVLVFLFLFTLFAFFPNVSSMYGSLSTLIMVMLWLYCCMNLLLYGAEINAYFENQFRRPRSASGN